MEIKLFEPNEPQLDALNVIYNDKPLITLMAYGRQTGKTYMEIMDAINYALNNKGVDIAFISPTYSQNSNVMDKVDSLFYGKDDIKKMVFKSVKYKEQKYYFHNGSNIEFLSSEQGDSIRGRTKDRVYIDEVAFMKRSFVFKIVLPFVTQTGGQLIFGSTFNGRNWFYKLYKRGLDPQNKKEVVSLLRTYEDLDDEDVTKVVDALRETMTKEEFAQEVLCRPITKDTLFVDVESAVGEANKENNDKLFIGIDVGISNDYTVVTVMNHKYEVVEIDRFNMRENHLSSGAYKERLLKLYYKYFENIVAAYMEINNNELLYDDIMDNYKDTYKIFPFITTATNKPKIINLLIKLFEDNEIVIPQDEQLISELYGFKSKKNEITGRLQYKNDGVDHDDMVMSLAIAAHCVDEESNSGIIEFI
jgi:hypothetical protein